MRTIVHPLSGATYDLEPDGHVRVVTRDGASGMFDVGGRWVSGQLRQADPHLCLWIAGRQVPTRSRHAAGAAKRDAAIPQEETTQ